MSVSFVVYVVKEGEDVFIVCKVVLVCVSFKVGNVWLKFGYGELVFFFVVVGLCVFVVGGVEVNGEWVFEGEVCVVDDVGWVDRVFDFMWVFKEVCVDGIF